MTSLVIGTLTSNEQNVIDKLFRLGLGFATDRTTSDDNKPSTSSKTDDQKESKRATGNLSKLKPLNWRHERKCTTETLSTSTQVQHLSDILSSTVKVELLNLTPTDRVLVIPKVLESLPSTSLLTPMTVKHQEKRVIPSRYNLR